MFNHLANNAKTLGLIQQHKEKQGFAGYPTLDTLLASTGDPCQPEVIPFQSYQSSS